MAGGKAALLEILLVIILRAMEVDRRLDLCDDRAAKALGRFELRLGSARRLFLRGRMVENRRAVLRSDIRALAVQCRWVVVLPEDIEELLVAHLGGIELDLANLGVAGLG